MYRNDPKWGLKAMNLKRKLCGSAFKTIAQIWIGILDLDLDLDLDLGGRGAEG